MTANGRRLRSRSVAKSCKIGGKMSEFRQILELKLRRPLAYADRFPRLEVVHLVWRRLSEADD